VKILITTKKVRIPALYDGIIKLRDKSYDKPCSNDNKLTSGDTTEAEYGLKKRGLNWGQK
jgi:hypothetical protein